jgi:hypothetical protein
MFGMEPPPGTELGKRLPERIRRLCVSVNIYPPFVTAGRNERFIRLTIYFHWAPSPAIYAPENRFFA